MQSNGLRVAVAVSRFNSFITERLLEGALEACKRHGVAEEAITIVKVPGAWELPTALDLLAKQQRFDCLIALGAVIRGDTPHFDYVAGQAASGAAQVMQKHAIPLAFGVLTTNTLEQAMDRAGGKAGNKGYEAALTALEMANLQKELSR